MITVVLPTWNGMPHLPAQVGSILRELPADGVLKVRDDGSTDGTCGWLEEEARRDPRLQRIPSEGRVGVIRGVELLLAGLPNGVVFLADQDDLWHPGKISRCLEALATADLVVHDARRVDADGIPLGDTLFVRRGLGGGLVANLWRNRFTGCCMAMRSTLLDAALPFPRHLPMHDQWLGLVALRHGRVAWLDESLMDYRVHAGNATATGGGRPAASPARRLLWRLQALQALCR